MLDTIKEAARWGRAPAIWLSGRANRKRLTGARVEIVGMVMCVRPTPSLLMVRSVYDDQWMPPQEGVNIGETFVDALARGLSEECQISIVDREGKIGSHYYLRNIEYVDTLWLPPERWGERAVAGNVGDSLLSQVVLKKKAYWAAYLVIDDVRHARVQANRREVSTAEWISFDDAAARCSTNRAEKAQMLATLLRRGMQHLRGVEAADSWYPPEIT